VARHAPHRTHETWVGTGIAKKKKQVRLQPSRTYLLCLLAVIKSVASVLLSVTADLSPTGNLLATSFSQRVWSLAQKASRVALALHGAKRNTPFGVTDKLLMLGSSQLFDKNARATSGLLRAKVVCDR
jgi:hypothetical protein